MINQRFGKLVCFKLRSKKKNYKSYRFRCDCGNSINVRDYIIQTGKVISCGCTEMDRIRQISFEEKPKKYSDYIRTSNGNWQFSPCNINWSRDIVTQYTAPIQNSFWN